MNELFARAMKIGIIAILAISAFFLLQGKTRLAAGVVFGFLWMAVNFFFTLTILNIATLKNPKTRLPALLLIKFPLLYLILFLFLWYKVFSLPGVAIGMGLFFISLGAARYVPRTS